MEQIKEYLDINTVNHTGIINRIIEQNHYTSYLEIGVEKGNNFREIQCAVKVGVDPDPASKATVHMTSDDYFVHIPENLQFDLIFVDGLHEWHQCYRDIINGLRHLAPGGTIVCHDMGPLEEAWTCWPRGEQLIWCGNVYKALIELQQNRRDVEVATLYNVDYGTAIIRKQWMPQTYFDRLDLEKLDFGEWQKNMGQLMGAIPWEVFEPNFLRDNYWEHKFSEFI